VVGEVYLAYSIASNLFAIVEHVAREGAVDDFLDGEAPDASAGPAGTIRTAWPTYTPQDPSQFSNYNFHGVQSYASILGPVPGDMADDKRRNVFAYVDTDLAAKLLAAGFDPKVWDEKKLRVIESWFSVYLHEFETATGRFASPELAAHWASEASFRQREWLADPELKNRLIARLSKIYVAGLHKRALEEGQKLAEQAGGQIAQVGGKLAAMEDEMHARQGDGQMAGELTGAIDYKDPKPEPVAAPPQARVSIEVPSGARVTTSGVVVVDAKVETGGGFTPPYEYRWSFVGMTAAESADGDLGFEDVDIGNDACTARLGRRHHRGQRGAAGDAAAADADAHRQGWKEEPAHLHPRRRAPARRAQG
jgi:hypothetical protein